MKTVLKLSQQKETKSACRLYNVVFKYVNLKEKYMARHSHLNGLCLETQPRNKKKTKTNSESI